MQSVNVLPRETLMQSLPFWTKVWNNLRPHAAAAAIEVGVYLRYWTMVLVAHAVRLIMSAVGIDAWLITLVGWMENVVFVSSFASFFWRLMVRLYNETKRGTL
jgi:hypothetical protein